MAPAKKKSELDEKRARELLSRERERVEAALADQERGRQSELSEIQVSADPVEDAEQIDEAAIDETLERRLRAELEAIERAEGRVEDGSYGLSVESGEPIPRGRLEAIPWAERTAEEQENYERIHGRPW
jgi:DnaK suppressor protein